MRSFIAFSVILFSIALTVGASASSPLIGRAGNGCSASNIEIFRHTVKHKEYFCQWWLSATRKRSPFIELLPSEVTAVCYCIGTPETNNKRSVAAIEDSSLPVKKDSLSDCRAELSSEFTEPRNFCAFYTRVPRASSPFKKFSVTDLLGLCDCIEGKSVTTSSSTTSSKTSSKEKTSSTTSSSPKTSSKNGISTSSSTSSSRSFTSSSSGTTSSGFASITTSSKTTSSASDPSTDHSSSTIIIISGSNNASTISTASSSTFSFSGVPANSSTVISSGALSGIPSSITSGNASIISPTSTPGSALANGTIPATSASASDVISVPYGNGTSSGILVGPTVVLPTHSSFSTAFPVNTSSSGFSNTAGPAVTGASSSFSSSTGSSGAPYGNGTSTVPSVGPTGPLSSGFSSSTGVLVNSTVSVVTNTGNSTDTAASTGFPSSIIPSGGPYSNGTSSTGSFGPTVPSTAGASSPTFITANSTANFTATAASSGFLSSIVTSGAPYGNGTSSTVLIGPTAPVGTGVSSSAAILTNSSTSAISTSEGTVPSSGFSSSASTSGAPYGNATRTSLSLGPTASVPTVNSSTSSILSSSVVATNGSTSFPSTILPSTPVTPITTGNMNDTSSSSTTGAPYTNSTISSEGLPTATISTVSSSAANTSSGASESFTNTPSTGLSTMTASDSTSTGLGTTTSSLATSSSSSATSSQSSSVPTSTQGLVRSGSRVYIGPQSPAFANRALESRQDGQNEYAAVYNGRRQPPMLGYSLNSTSGYLYLGNSQNVLSYEIPAFRSDSVQLATLTQDYLTTYPSSWNPLKCTVTEPTGALACTAVSRSTRYRPSVTYSVFVTVPRSGQAAADIYLYAANKIDGRPLGATEVPFFVSMDGQGWASKK